MSAVFKWAPLSKEKIHHQAVMSVTKKLVSLNPYDANDTLCALWLCSSAWLVQRQDYCLLTMFNIQIVLSPSPNYSTSKLWHFIKKEVVVHSNKLIFDRKLRQEVPSKPSTSSVATVNSDESGEGGRTSCVISATCWSHNVTSSFFFLSCFVYEMTPACRNVPCATHCVSITALRQAAADLS